MRRRLAAHVVEDRGANARAHGSNGWVDHLLDSVYDISTPVLLYNASSRPLSILMLEYSFAGARERSAAIGVLLTVVVLLVLLASRSFGYRASRERL